MPNQDPELVAGRLRDIVVDFGLRELKAVTDTHIITVREPGLFESTTELKAEIEKIDL